MLNVRLAGDHLYWSQFRFSYLLFNKTESAIFVSLMCSLLPEDFHSELILSSLQLVLCHVAAVKRLRTS